MSTAQLGGPELFLTLLMYGFDGQYNLVITLTIVMSGDSAASEITYYT